MSNTGHIGRNLVIIVAGQVMISLQGLIAMPIIIRMAGPAVYGANVLLIFTIGFLFNLMWNGISYRYRRSLVSTAGREDRRRLFESQFALQLSIVAAVILCVFIAHPQIQRLLFQGTADFSPWLLSGWIVAYLICDQTLMYFSFSQRFLLTTIAEGARPYVYLALLLGITFTGISMSLDALMAASVITLLCVSLPIVPIILLEIGIPRLRIPVRSALQDVREAWPLTVKVIVDFALSISDRYLILFFISVNAVGEYQPAYTLASLTTFFGTLTEPILIPAASRLVDIGDRIEAENMVAMFVRLFLLMAIPFSFGALMVGPSIIALMVGPEIATASRWVVASVSFAMIFYGVMRFAALIGFVMGRMRVLVGPMLLGAFINVGANLVLLPLLQSITVAGVTTLIGYAATAIYACYSLRSEWRIALQPKSVLQFVLASIVMSITLWLLGYRPAAVADFSAFYLTLAVTAAFGVYFGTLWILGAIDRRELERFKQLLHRRVALAGESDE